MVPPVVQSVFGSQVRLALGILGAILVKNGWTTEATWASIALDLSPIIVAAIWGGLEKVWSRRKLVTAQALPAGVTEDDVEYVIKQGNAPPVTLDKHEAPYLGLPAPTDEHRGTLP